MWFKYRIYSNIPAAGIAFQLIKKDRIMREAGVLERQNYFFSPLKYQDTVLNKKDCCRVNTSALKCKFLKILKVANRSEKQFENGRSIFQQINKEKALH